MRRAPAISLISALSAVATLGVAHAQPTAAPASAAIQPAPPPKPDASAAIPPTVDSPVVDLLNSSSSKAVTDNVPQLANLSAEDKKKLGQVSLRALSLSTPDYVPCDQLVKVESTLNQPQDVCPKFAAKQ